MAQTQPGSPNGNHSGDLGGCCRRLWHFSGQVMQPVQPSPAEIALEQLYHFAHNKAKSEILGQVKLRLGKQAQINGKCRIRIKVDNFSTLVIWFISFLFIFYSFSFSVCYCLFFCFFWTLSELFSRSSKPSLVQFQKKKVLLKNQNLLVVSLAPKLSNFRITLTYKSSWERNGGVMSSDLILQENVTMDSFVLTKKQNALLVM